ncbi:MAG TPA: NAD-dependent succinate-semialdehyde dehydrogenase [Nitriliruptorales bacterium]|nr:NAD-dependent succinate-semialdehyde dehydrogenase [Nitriliruptorales bacterium]
MITTVNPATGDQLETYDEHGDDAITWKLARAFECWVDDWRHRGVQQRVQVLARAADVLDKRRDELAELITREMGKPMTAARSELEKCAWLCRHYVEAAAGYLEPEVIDTDAHRSYVRFDPLGPIFAIMPWNFPFWQAFRFAVPNLAAGNVGLLKHSANTTGCGLAIEEVLAQAGLPEGGFQTLVIGHDKAAEVMGDRRIRGVTLTGSDRAGRAVAETAGRHLKKTVLELGGSDPLVVLEDADLYRAAEAACSSRYLNSGQSCINAKRIIVLHEVLDDFLDRFRANVEALTVGDPMDPGTDVGPLARGDLRDAVHDQVQRTLEHRDGGTLVLGGEPLDRPGFYYAPTIIRDVNAEAPAASEEVFGPVAAVMGAESEEAALALTNASHFGLGAAVWTADLDRGERLAGLIEAGIVFVNEVVRSDPRLPFGGVKDSGYGRELAREGAREFTDVKTVWVNRPAASRGTTVE